MKTEGQEDNQRDACAEGQRDSWSDRRTVGWTPGQSNRDKDSWGWRDISVTEGTKVQPDGRSNGQMENQLENGATQGQYIWKTGQKDNRKDGRTGAGADRQTIVGRHR